MFNEQDLLRISAAFEASIRALLISRKRVHLFRLGFLELREEPMARQRKDCVGLRMRIEKGVQFFPFFEKCEDPSFLSDDPSEYVSENEIASTAFPFLPERLKSSVAPCDLVRLLRDELVAVRGRIDSGALCTELFGVGSLLVNPSRSSVSSDFFGQREISIFSTEPIFEQVKEVHRFTPPSLFYFYELFEAAFGVAKFRATADSIAPQSEVASLLRSVVVSAWQKTGDKSGCIYVTDGARSVLGVDEEFSVFVPKQIDENESCPLWPALTLVRAVEARLLASKVHKQHSKVLGSIVSVLDVQPAVPGGAKGFLATVDGLLPSGAVVKVSESGAERKVDLLRLTPLLEEELNLAEQTSPEIVQAVLAEKKVLGMTSQDRRPVTLRGLTTFKRSEAREVSTNESREMAPARTSTYSPSAAEQASAI